MYGHILLKINMQFLIGFVVVSAWVCWKLIKSEDDGY
jgi:flagellar biogenesis protein FliO